VSSANNDYWVYILSNNTRSTLYIGITSELRVRVWQHRVADKPGSFSERHHCAHLVYFEHYREEALIATLNPDWDDLAEDWVRSVNELPRPHRRQN
jgi:putative endonuclease